MELMYIKMEIVNIYQRKTSIRLFGDMFIDFAWRVTVLLDMGQKEY